MNFVYEYFDYKSVSSYSTGQWVQTAIFLEVLRYLIRLIAFFAWISLAMATPESPFIQLRRRD